MDSITFTPEKLKRFKEVYAKALEYNQEIFIFEDHQIVVGFAKYMIEYLEAKMKGE